MATAQWFTFDGAFSGEGANLPSDKLLLDTLSETPAYQAYSFRKLYLEYAGFAVTVRRSSDNTTADVGFDADGLLDTDALLAFAGAGDAFVATWYDQSGHSSRNLVQATAAKQPQIVASGALITVGGAPGMLFGVADMHLKHSQPGTATLVASTGLSSCQVHTDRSSCVAYAESKQNSTGGRVYVHRWASGLTISMGVFDDANNSQAFQPSFTANAVDEAHSDILLKPSTAGASHYRDGAWKASNTTFNPTMPTGLTSATLGGYEGSSAGLMQSDYTGGKVGEHFILSGVLSSGAIAEIAASHAAYFGL